MAWVMIVIKYGLPVLLAGLNIHQFLYNKNPKYFFFLLKRFKKWRDTKWKIHANYSVNADVDVFKVSQRAIEKTFGSYQRTVNMSNKKHYDFGDFSLLILYDADVSSSNIKRIDLNFNPVNVTYYTAKLRLAELRKLFLEIEKNIDSNATNYNMDIHFTNNKNPFFGLMIQRLGRDNMEYFECRFDMGVLREKNGDKYVPKNSNKLRVFKEKVSINENSFDTIEDVAKDILLMG